MTESNERCDRQQATDKEVELIRKIKDALREIELIEKPFALYIHPNDYQKMQEVGVPEEALREYEIIETTMMDQGKVLIVKRKEMLSWCLGTDMGTDK